MRTAIIGGGAAGFEAACRIRNRMPEAEIVLISDEDALPYRRPALTRMLGETVPDNQFFQKTAAFYDEQRIELRLGCRIASIDRAGHKLVCCSGDDIAYDKLLIASGADARTLPLPGADGPQVFRGRALADFTGLQKYIAANRVTAAAVIGGGLLGLEFAEGLLSRGLKVTVIECSPTIMPNQLDDRAARLFSDIMRRCGNLSARYGEQIAAIEPGRVITSSGEPVEAGVVVWSVGAVPRTALAKAAGLAVNRAIVADNHLRTGDPDIFAAGDCAEICGRVSGLWNPAKEQGAAAADNICGEAVEYCAKFSAARFAGFGTRIYSAGTVNLCGDNVTREVECDPDSGKYSCLTYRGGKLAGVLLMGDVSSALNLERKLADGK